MKRSIIVLVGVFVGLIALFSIQPESQSVSAGGFPCFLCHGVNFEGSDLAPTVAGTKLTDEQIANQMRHPRGVMPAFAPSDWPDPQTAISYIRAQPTGKPTMALSPEQRSQALALIGGVALARATEYARVDQSGRIDAPTPEPTRQVSSKPVATGSTWEWGIIGMIGGLLGFVVVVYGWAYA
ncbi:MAG: cytochrome c [Chloroflexi bacterium]|nr:cytochrome c [Chloroflexota bacterium]